MNRPSKTRNRPYDRSEPAALGEVISQLFTLRGYNRVQGNKQLDEVWAKVAGEEIAEQTKVSGLKNSILQVGVSNSALVSELTAFLKVEILEQLQADHSDLKIRDIKFKLRSDLTK